ncbi:hypothetical protein [Streptomyces sp.]|uniref:hypothetical protein n=1 Tax=Streptomyces sp. TaxID=1931 RepID=UPI002F92BEFA
MTAPTWPAADLPPVRPLPNPWPGGPTVFPTATDPALAGWEPPTLDDLGLTADPVANALNVLRQLTDQQLDAVLAYYPPAEPTAADYQRLRAELDAQQAALTAIPADAWEHRRTVAAEHRAKQQAARDRLDGYYLAQRSAA